MMMQIIAPQLRRSPVSNGALLILTTFGFSPLCHDECIKLPCRPCSPQHSGLITPIFCQKFHSKFIAFSNMSKFWVLNRKISGQPTVQIHDVWLEKHGKQHAIKGISTMKMNHMFSAERLCVCAKQMRCVLISVSYFNNCRQMCAARWRKARD